MQCNQEKQEHCVVLRIEENRLDAVVSQDLKECLLTMIKNGDTDIGIDMSPVDFVDSTGLGVLVSVLNSLGQNGSLFFWGVSSSVKSMFELTQLYKVFEIYETEEDALAKFK